MDVRRYPQPRIFGGPYQALITKLPKPAEFLLRQLQAEGHKRAVHAVIFRCHHFRVWQRAGTCVSVLRQIMNAFVNSLRSDCLRSRIGMRSPVGLVMPLKLKTRVFGPMAETTISASCSGLSGGNGSATSRTLTSPQSRINQGCDKSIRSIPMLKYIRDSIRQIAQVILQP